MRKGEVAGVVLVFRDVTERREQENSLSDALIYAQSIIATLREPFIALDKDLRVRTANDAYYRIFRTSKAETEGQLFCELEGGQWNVAGLRQRLENVLADHHPINDFEIAQSFSNLGHRIVVLNATRFVSKNSFPDLLLLAIEDVTERRQLERAKMQAEISADLHRRKDEFLAMLSHELRNPLAPIQNAIHILRLKAEDDPIQQQARRIIERQVGQMTALVNDLVGSLPHYDRANSASPRSNRIAGRRGTCCRIRPTIDRAAQAYFQFVAASGRNLDPSRCRSC